MSSFYKQYPEVSFKNVQYNLIKYGIYSTILVFIAVLFLSYKEGVDNDKIIIIALIFTILTVVNLTLIVPFIKNIFQKNYYLLKYGKRGEAVWESKKGFMGITNGGVLNIEGTKINYKFGENFQSLSNINPNKKLQDKIFRSLNDGDKIKIIYNPENLKDFVLDLKTNV